MSDIDQAIRDAAAALVARFAVNGTSSVCAGTADELAAAAVQAAAPLLLGRLDDIRDAAAGMAEVLTTTPIPPRSARTDVVAAWEAVDPGPSPQPAEEPEAVPAAVVDEVPTPTTGDAATEVEATTEAE